MVRMLFGDWGTFIVNDMYLVIGAPLLYMALCVPLSFFLYPEANGEHGYVQVTNTTSEGNITTEVTVV